MSGDFSDLVSVLRWRAEHQPDRTAYHFLTNGESSRLSISYRELDLAARAVAATLQERIRPGDRVLLLYPPGLEYISAFFGCLYAGAVAVPAYPPRPRRPMTRLSSIAADAGPSVALTSVGLAERLREFARSTGRLDEATCLTPDGSWSERADEWREPPIGPDTLAFLQYTSGSTASPKGVMLSHRNLIHNTAQIWRCFALNEESRAVLWLPPYHDMGLIGGILTVLRIGFPLTLMSPVAFLQRPIRWLKAISSERADVSGAPNSAYALCVDRITPKQRDTLDLSCLKIAFCGAEPVQRDTLERFADFFAPCGFRWEAFYPCYGLAEATLIVSGGDRTLAPVTEALDADALERNEVVRRGGDGGRGGEGRLRHLVGCGSSLEDQRVAIVDPKTRKPLGDERIGEIWVSGPSVALGYWQKPEESRATFGARLADGGENAFLRTGDLGFLRRGELFVVGRIKDLIIVHGRNHHPHDIESTVVSSLAGVPTGLGAAFAVEVGSEERLVVAQELNRRGEGESVDEIAAAVRAAVAAEHEIELHALVLVRRGSLPKTSSGKVQRRACKRAYLAGTLEVLAEWTRPTAARLPADGGGVAASGLLHPAAEAIRAWLISRVSALLEIDPRELDPRRPFSDYGIDSVRAVTLAGELESWLGREVSPTLAWDHPNIDSAARFLAQEATSASAARGAETAIAGSEPIAIVGMACRFPGAESLPQFWTLLREGRHAVGRVPAERWGGRDAGGGEAGEWAALLGSVDRFDPGFFGISPHEADRMDPQQRLLLEVAWEALEDSGELPGAMGGTATGVFVGISNNDYGRLLRDGAPADAYVGTGNALSIAANRLSYAFGFEGPSLAVDTACSSSLLAVHLAGLSLRAGECEVALAGGVNLILSPHLHRAFSEAKMLAPDGRCKTFAAAADGYVRGEGCGLIVLKRLSDARRDGNRVLALIRGSAVNQDGRSNGLTAPRGPAQEAVIQAALGRSGEPPGRLSYVEAHGTGTPLGDPIEIRALASVLCKDRARDRPLRVGSVKTNIGHLESAAGIAGLIKTVLALMHREIPPHLNLEERNPHIDWDKIPIEVPTRLTSWTAEGPRLAGVSSFGFGGTNVHLVLEEAAEEEEEEASNLLERPLHLLAISAQSRPALRQLADRFSQALSSPRTAPTLADLAYTANRSRTGFPHRLAVVGDSRREVAEKLAKAARGRLAEGAFIGEADDSEPPGIVFLFTGQGSQYPGMANRLYETQPVFRKALDRCDALLRELLSQPLLSILYRSNGSPSLLDETEYTQPALFAIEYALAALWRSWGVEPAAVMGHSVGEIGAACVAGVLELEDAIRLIARRGRLMQDLPHDGSMAAVFADRPTVEAAIAEHRSALSIAAVNGARETVVSGERRALEQVLQRLERDQVESRLLSVSHAFHSPLMEPILDDLEETARALDHRPARVCLVSNLDGQAIEVGETRDWPGHWRRHAREPVLLDAGFSTLRAKGHRVYVEVGPRPALLGLAGGGGKDWLMLPSLRPGRDDWAQMLESLGELYAFGCRVSWEGFDQAYRRRRVALPTYPFERQRHWLPEAMAAPGAPSPEAVRSEEAAAEAPVAAREPEIAAAVRRIAAAPPAERRELIEATLRTEVSKVLGLKEPPHPRRKFAELGMDSLMAVRLRRQLEESLGRELPSTVAFDYPTLGSLADFLAEVLGEEAGEPAPAAASRSPAAGEAIAAIGISCRLPGGATDAAAFWDLLREGRDASGEVPAERWDAESFFDPDPETGGKSYTRRGSFLDGPIDLFDAGFFAIAPREAVSMDPQQRLLLELAWEALEHSAQAADRLSGSRTGVFVGINSSDYGQERVRLEEPDGLDAYAFTGNTFSVAAGRLSHALGLQGPSLSIDTACSSSLVAVHLAVQSLRAGECDLALAGGVSLMISPLGFLILSRMRALSPDGRCKTFDSAADGYGRGEGGGLVVLKRLSDARAAGDRILAVIRGSAVNHDGPSSGLTVPNGPAQESLLRAALANAGCEPPRLGYLEAHGTGTPLGDPMELEAIGRALGAERPPERPLLVGSVKTNFGHLEAAAGIASLIKVILALQHGEIPPHLHFRNPTREVDWDRLPIAVPTALTPWPAGAAPRLAGVSSFGMSGTNAHVVVEEAPREPVEESVPAPAPHLVALSARDEESLRRLAGRHGEHLVAHPELAAGDVAYTLNVGRARLERRLAVLAGSTAELGERLSAFAAGVESAGVMRSEGSSPGRPRVAFLFTGQGSQYVGMGRRLYETEPVFRGVLDRCERRLGGEPGRGLLSVVFGEAPEASSLLDRTLYTQPALFVLQMGLVALWRSWGVEPSVVVGHSIGEIAAACAAGVLDLESGLELVAGRARLMASLPSGGGMASVLAERERVEPALSDEGGAVVAAAYNAPSHTVISGEEGALDRVLSRLGESGIRVRRLAVSHAFHSPRMEPVLEELERLGDRFEPGSARCRLISTLSGEAVAGEAMDGSYWRRQARSPVDLVGALGRLWEQGCEAVLEIGPAPTLVSLGQQCVAEPERAAWLASLRPGREERETMLTALARLYLGGVEVDWAGVHRPHRGRRLALPTYPFRRERHWTEPGDAARPRRPARRRPEDHPLLGSPLDSPPEDLHFETELRVDSVPLVGDHRIRGLAWMNFVLYLEMAHAAARRALGAEPVVLEKTSVPHGLVLPDRGGRVVHLTLETPRPDEAEFRIHSQLGGPGRSGDRAAWQLNAGGTARRASEAERVETRAEPPAEISGRCGERLSPAELYAVFERHGARLGDSCRVLEAIWRRDGEALGRLADPPAAEADERFSLPLTAIDAGFQLLAAAVPAHEPRDLLLTFVGRFRSLESAAAGRRWARVVLRPAPAGDPSVRADVFVLDDDGRVLVEIEDARAERFAAEAVRLEGESREEVEAGRKPSAALAAVLAAGDGERPERLCAYLLETLGKALALPAERLDPEVPLVTQIDSLMAVEVKRRVEVDLDVELPVAALFDASSVRDLAAKLSARLAGAVEPAAASESEERPGRGERLGDPAPEPGGEMSVAELRAEAALAPEIDSRSALPPAERAEVILLTGATGYLGAFLLADLLATTEATVYCLVRAADVERARSRLLENLAARSLPVDFARHRVVPILGDLARPLLSLPAQDFERLGETIDAVIHCGAMVKWTYPYAALKPANVLGTHEVLRLAATGRVKPTHFISTVGVFASPELGDREVLETDRPDDGGPLSVGYAQSKWVAEKLVWLAAERGLPVSVYRPNIGGHSTSGVFNLDDHLCLMIKGCIQLGSFPRIDLSIAPAPVDYVSRAIVALSARSSSLGNAFHLVNSPAWSWAELVSWLRDYGYPLEERSYEDWKRDLLESISRGEANALRGLAPIFSEGLFDRSRLPAFDVRRTRDALRESSIVCPPLGETLLGTYFSYFVRSGFLSEPARVTTSP